MPELTEHLLNGFRAGLRKEAGFADLMSRAAPRLRSAGSLAGVGALAGSLAGGGLAGTKAYREAKEEGHGTARAALHALGGGLGGAVSGAAGGALLGGAVGGASGLGKNLTARTGAIGAASRFGQRQIHALTGVLNPAELESIGGGAATARSAYKALEDKAFQHATTPGGAFSDYAGKLQKAQRGLDASVRAQDMGLTSIPGYLRSMKEHGLAPTLGASIKDQWHSMTPGNAALMVGLPAALAAGTLIKKEHPTGPGKGEELGRNIGGLVGGIAGGAMPIVGNAVVGSLASSAGGQIGKGIDWMRGRRKPLPMIGGKPDLEPAEGQHIPSERVMSPAAAGQMPEVNV